jgi:hypothetical protein
MTLHDRILAALSEFKDGKAAYRALMYKVWPPDKYPRAYRHSANGGPPGVAMIYGRALRELHEQGLIMRMSRFIGSEDKYWGQPDVLLLSAGKLRIKNGEK